MWYAQVAIKFYLDLAAFSSNQHLYKQSAVIAAMPDTLSYVDNADGSFKTPYGYTFPPFVILKCGKSLGELACNTADRNIGTVLQVMLQDVFVQSHANVPPFLVMISTVCQHI